MIIDIFNQYFEIGTFMIMCVYYVFKRITEKLNLLRVFKYMKHTS